MKDLCSYTQDKLTELFNKTGSFFAFSPKQFEEQRKEGVKYTNVGAGLICPKDTCDELIAGLDAIYKNGIAQDLQENGKDKIIERELYNHEAFYTWSIQQTVESLVDYGITVNEVRAVFNRLTKTANADW